MKACRRAFLIVCLFASIGAALAGSDDGGPAQPVKHDLADLGWLAGCWGTEDQASSTEECWLPPKGGIMLAVHRDVRSSGKVFFEFLRIEAGEKGIVYLASPRGQPATPFRLRSLETRRAVFENPEHDFPQRILYWLDGEESLHARIEGRQADEQRSEEWTWKRRSWD